MLINLIVWLIVGALAGWLAGVVMGSQQSLLGNIILGILGSFVGGGVLTLLTGSDNVESGLSIGHILTATIGAVIIIALVRMLRRA